MKYINRRWAKFSALIVLILASIMIFVGVSGIVVHQELEMDRYSKEEVLMEAFENILSSKESTLLIQIPENYNPETQSVDPIRMRGFDAITSNYAYRVVDGEGNDVIHSDEAIDVGFAVTTKHLNRRVNPFGDPKTLVVESGVNLDYPVWDQFKVVATYVGFLSIGVGGLLTLSLISGFIWLVALVFIIKSLGRHRASDEIRLRGRDRIPFELYLVGSFLVKKVLDVAYDVTEGNLWATFLIMGFYLLVVLDLLVSLIIRIKSKTLIQNTYIHRIVVYLKKTYTKLPALKKALAVYGVYVACEFIIFAEVSGRRLIFFWFVKSIGIGVLLVKVLLDMKQLETATETISKGDIDYVIDVADLLPAFHPHAHNINQISDSVEEAVSEQMKSERMKTELITNVSHDIKTPLTSILNYVDLLSKEELNNELAYSYLEPLNRQSKKLSNLVDNLLVASRVSSGNIDVNLEPMKLNVFVEQTAGEFLDRMKEKKLNLIVSGTEAEIVVSADQQLMSRTLDNLLSNVINYSLENTRVYLSVGVERGVASITLKNITREPLNVEEQDLLERFVRGDSSRNTEGNGLGLSIAKSMVELQDGVFELSIDGDLFKVVCSFNIHA